VRRVIPEAPAFCRWIPEFIPRPPDLSKTGLAPVWRRFPVHRITGGGHGRTGNAWCALPQGSPINGYFPCRFWQAYTT